MATPPFIPNAGGGTSSTSFFNSPLFGGILSGLGSLAQGILGNQAANAQADAATNSAAASNALLAGIYAQNRQDQAPFTLAGYGAVGKLQDYFGLNPQRYRDGGSTVSAGPTSSTIDNSQFPLGRGSTSDPSIGYSGGVAYPLDGEGMYNGDRLPTLADLSGSNPTGSVQNITTAVPQNGGQLPADFGSLNHDFSLADFQADPGYQFRQDEGQKAIERSAAARGSVLGGGTLKSLSRYSQGLASQEYGDAFNRYQVNRSNKINPLFSLAGLGQTSAGQVASSGTSLGTQGANINFQGGVDAGAARASGYASTANAINNGLSNIYSLSRYGRIG